MSLFITGKRLPDAPEGDVLPDHVGGELRGGYWRAGGVWYCGVPARGCGIGNLTAHAVTEHEDGTITVEPSILVTTGHGNRWHGYLRAGVWEQLDDTTIMHEGDLPC